MQTPRREYCRLVLSELRLDQGVKSILLDEASLQLPLDHRKELVRARVQMGDVEPTRLDDRDGTRNPQLRKYGEVVDGGEENGAASGARGLVVEVEHSQLAEGVAGEEVAAAVTQEQLEPIVHAGRALEVCRNYGRVGNDGDRTGHRDGCANGEQAAECSGEGGGAEKHR